MDDLVLQGQTIAAGDEILHEGVGTIARAACDGRKAAMADLIVSFSTAQCLCASRMRSGLNSAVMISRGRSVVHSARIDPSKLTSMPSPIESKSPSDPHMQTLAVAIRFWKLFAWFVKRHAARRGAV